MVTVITLQKLVIADVFFPISFIVQNNIYNPFISFQWIFQFCV